MGRYAVSQKGALSLDWSKLLDMLDARFSMRNPGRAAQRQLDIWISNSVEKGDGGGVGVSGGPPATTLFVN